VKCDNCGSEATKTAYFYAHELDVCDKYPKCKQTVREQVAEFHDAMNQKDPPTPTIPPDERVNLRAALITEEYFEVMEAMFDDPSLAILKKSMLEACGLVKVRVNLPELADGLADLDYVVSGTYLEFGIDSGPVAAEVHRANMAKFIGEPVWAPNGKRLKPAGWTPPDIEGELRKQGWKP
jgi:predicted HAD superfamily Cof-like phosphohydrolase